MVNLRRLGFPSKKFMATHRAFKEVLEREGK